MSRTSVQYSKWMITLDGVQIPYVAFSVRTGVDEYGQATIIVEPDQILSRLRARTMVHIWMYDNFEEKEDIKDKYKLYWEGELRGYAYSKIPTRNFTLTAVGCLQIFETHRSFMSGVGETLVSPMISGSALLSPVQGISSKSLFTLMLTAQSVFNKNVRGGVYPDSDIDYRHDSKINYADRLLKLLVYFTSYNASLRLHAVRNRILNKIAYLPDQTLGLMIPVLLASQFFSQLGEDIGQEDSVLTMIKKYNAYVFHHFVSQTAPHFPEKQPKSKDGNWDLVGAIGKKVKESPYSIVRTYYRNDYLVMPETFYAIPPSCNFIFPEYIRHVAVGRDFFSEPTRGIITDHTMETMLSVIVPDEILRYKDRKAVEPADFWNMTNLQLQKTEKDAAGSPYELPKAAESGGIRASLLNAISDEEIEKGIIPWRVEQPMYIFKAMAHTLNLESDEARNALRNKLGTILRLAPLVWKAGDDPKSKNRAFIYIMKVIADYTLQLNRLRRSVNISLEGHRWLCPGLPAPILDTDISFLGWVKAHTFSVDENGGETSEVELDYVRPFPAMDPAKVDEISRVTEQRKKKVDQHLNAFKMRWENYGETTFDLSGAALRSFRVDKEQWKAAEEGGLIAIEVSDPELGIASMDAPQATEIRDGVRAWNKLQVRWLSFYNEVIGTKESPATPAGRAYLVQEPAREPLVRQMEHIKKELVVFESQPFYEDLDKRGRFAAEMSSELWMFARYQEEQAEKAKEEGEAYLGTLSHMGDSAQMSELAGARQGYVSLGESLDPPEDYPFPPVFANMDLLSLGESEKIYQELFGAQPALSKFVKDLVEPFSGQKEKASDIQMYHRTAYGKFNHFLAALSRVFPVLSPRAPDTDAGTPSSETEGTNKSKWEDLSSKEESQESVRKWEEKVFLRRTGLMSLGDFIRTHNVELQTRTSTQPSPTPFYVLAPIDEIKHPSPVGQLKWDNTIFSKIVDEFEDVKRMVENPDLGGAFYKHADYEILKLRKSVKTKFLTTRARQERIINYSRRHFGARAFDGA